MPNCGHICALLVRKIQALVTKLLVRFKLKCIIYKSFKAEMSAIIKCRENQTMQYIF